MGTTVMDVKSVENLPFAIHRPIRQYMGGLSHPSNVKEIRLGFEETNKAILAVMADWYKFLQLLEQNPQNYKSMCRDGDVAATIEGLEEVGNNPPTEVWTSFGKLIKKFDTATYEKFKEVDENAKACRALLREVSWNLLLLDREHKPCTGGSYPIDEVIASLRS